MMSLPSIVNDLPRTSRKEASVVATTIVDTNGSDSSKLDSPSATVPLCAEDTLESGGEISSWSSVDEEDPACIVGIGNPHFTSFLNQVSESD